MSTPPKPGPRGKRPVVAGKRPDPRQKRSADTVARIYELLHGMVSRFEIPPGERLNEVELARRLDVSRTPLREALNRLVTDGLLQVEPNRGFRCRPLETQDILDLYEARSIIEVAGIRLACRRAKDEEIDRLDGFWSKAAAEIGLPVTDLLRQDEEFHERLLALSGNGELVRALKTINARIHFVRWMDLERQERREGTYREHADMLAALRARDERRCMDLMSGHIDRRLDQIVEVIKAGVVRLYLRS